MVFYHRCRHPHKHNTHILTHKTAYVKSCIITPATTNLGEIDVFLKVPFQRILYSCYVLDIVWLHRCCFRVIFGKIELKSKPQRDNSILYYTQEFSFSKGEISVCTSSLQYLLCEDIYYPSQFSRYLINQSKVSTIILIMIIQNHRRILFTALSNIWSSVETTLPFIS